ncbi:MAG: hypothetical protein JWM63_1997 [Gammaproteobacteria bacterium]|nr:hypothetical protein [Gammaproteobacteria bacterium]
MPELRPAIDAAVRAAVSNSNRSTPQAPKYLSLALWAAALVLGLGSTAQAQKPADEAAQGGGTKPTIEEITVTGSRIKRSNDFDPATPTTVVDSNYLENLGITNVGGALTQMPSNISTFSPATTGNSSFFAGSIIPNLRGLNPFFGSRTLALVDGKRFVPTNQGDGLDLNFIPSVLIDHMDVVTGGASAAYGSGAVAGVTNFVMNRKLEGGKIEVDYGETQHQDARDKHVGAAYGMSLLDGKGHFVLGGEWEDSGTASCLSRDWCRNAAGFYPIKPGSYVLGSNLRSTQASTSGVFFNFNPTATTTSQSNAAGNGLMPYNIGLQPYSAGSPFNNFPGGDGPSIYQHTNLTAPVKREVVTGMFTVALTDKVNMKLDASWGQVKTINYTAAVTANFISIAPDNAYVQQNPALAAAIAPVGPTFLDKLWDSQVNSQTNVETTVRRAALSFDGQFGESSWTWDGYYEYGHTYRTQVVQDNLHLNEATLALDSVLVNGVPTCRSLAPGGRLPFGYTADPTLANGCVPLNPFGTGPLSAAAKAYAFGNLVENLTYTQNVVALNTTGNLFDGVGFGAGPVSGAVGVEYRTEKGENIDNPGVPSNVASDYLIQYGASFSGKVNVTEGYVETNIPVFKNLPGADRLEFDAALRESRYDNQGLAGTDGTEAKHNMTTWKLTGIWDPVSWLRFRGSKSRDSRAANFRELYYEQLIGAGGLFGYCDPPTSSRTQPCNWTLKGNTALRPESSDTTTIGVVLTPKELLPGFQFAADYFRINIKDAIQQANVTSVLTGCRQQHIAADCALLTPAVPGDYTIVKALTALASNGSGYLFKGIDFTTSYLFDMGGGRNLDVRLLATRMIDQLYQPVPGGPFVNVVGQTGTGNSFLADFQPTSKWVGNLTATYSQGPVAVTGQVRYVSAGTMNYNGYPPGATLPTPPATGYTLATNSVPSYEVFNLAGSYRFSNMGSGSLQLFGAVNNLFDKAPPVAAGVGGFGASNNFGGTNATFFDTLGRTFKLGVRMTF